MKTKLQSHFKNGIILSSIVLGLSLLFSCGEWVLPKELVGHWKSNQEVTVRFKEKGKPFQFISQPVEINLSIKEDGTMEGKIGNALLTGYKVIKNRSWFGRQFDLATDYHITGKIIGKVFDSDPLLEKEFNFPFDMDDNTITGTIFQKQGIGISPMVDVRLVKE